MRKTRLVMAGLFAVALLAGFGCDNTDNRHQQLEDPDGNLYTEKFTCNQAFTGQPLTCPDFNEVAHIQFTRIGSNLFEVRDVPDSGFVMTGSFSGVDFYWTATSPNGYTETGVWRFSSNSNTFSGSSHYVADDDSYSGDCFETGDIGVSSPPDPPMPAGCP